MNGRIMELVGHVHLTWRRRVARDLAPFGIAPKQIYVLRKLAASSLTPSELAELLFADRPTVSSMLRTLERARWVSRRRDPEDGKRVIVELTAAGRAKLAAVPEALWRTGKTSFDPEAGLTRPERVELVRLLEKLDAHVGRATDEEAAR
ncbi:MAG: MarR family transcriptional regulator [Deltaproteobacteria bacterium]|nr:MarR family transcriptional regulator [Deltaproteobacteria bacterium]